MAMKPPESVGAGEDDVEMRFDFLEAPICCGIAQPFPRSKVATVLLANPLPFPPSLLQKCLCNSQNAERLANDMHTVPQIAPLQGITIQSGNPSLPTEGHMQTLKFWKFDKSKRTVTGKVMGGFGSPTGTGGGWAFNADKFPRVSLCAAPLLNFTYKIKFIEDWTQADISLMMNPICCCIPCLPPWCTIPSCLVRFTMAQVDGDNSNWLRSSYVCGKEVKSKQYNLKAAYTADGAEAKYADLVWREAPENLMVAR